MKFFLLCILIGIIGLCGCASSGDVDILDERLYTLERKNTALEKETRKLSNTLSAEQKANLQNSQKLRDQAAMLSAEIGLLQEALRISRGVVEETDFSLKKRLESIEKGEDERDTGLENMQHSLQAVKNRLERLEQYLNLEISGEATAPKTPLDPAQPVTPTTEREVYQAAKQALDNGDAERARKEFQAFLKRFPKSSYAGNAQFWIGEIFFREKWYEKAILEYQKVIERYKADNKVPAALLKQGLAFYHLNDKANARLILQQLIKKYPKSNEALVARKKVAGL